ncbi:glycosyltransferase family 4 protein [Persicobacter diffluens]|uniref:Uncharacterized protein n=1 Tax=Persicobacter diffluens TaxID=981 RepID=A0AAN4W279_9BACT|nr:hypothetical protein PEDI_40810 [Persicobacter diffluens]
MKIAIASWINIDSLKEFFDQEIPEEIRALGAPATAITNIVKGMHALGHEIIIFTLDYRSTGRFVFKGERITLVLDQERNRARYKLWDGWKYEINQIKSLCLEYEADIYHAHWSYEYALGVIKSGQPHLITFRDDAWEILKYFKDIYRLGKFALDRRVKAEGKHFSVNSIYLQRQLARFQNGIRIIPNPVNPDMIHDQEKAFPENGTIRILSILTGFQKRKNPKRALQAFDLLRKQLKRPMEYHIYGMGFYKGSEGHQWALANGLTENVVFHGHVAYDELVRDMGKYDLLFHPALEESFGNTLLEGMATGIPVVAGKAAGAVPWVLGNGSAGYLVDVERVEEMAKALQNVLTDGALYARLVKGGKARISESFDRKKIAQLYIDYYHEIIEDARGKQVRVVG